MNRERVVSHLGTTGRARRLPAISPPVVLGLVLTVAVVYWLWFGLTLRNIDHDDGISIMAAQGILEYGYQRFPSGYVYGRGYLSHYLLAAALGVFGLNNFSIMLPNLLLGLGSLFLVYRIARYVLRRPWLGVAAATLLIALSVQTWYATGPRMYMPVQFFTLLGMYGVWRGYVEGEGKYRWVAILAISAATLSADQGVVIAVALPVATLVVMRLRGESWSRIFSGWNIASTLFLGGLVFFVATFNVPAAMPLVVGHAGVDPNRVGLSLNPVNWGRHVLHLERSIPYGLAFLLVAYLAFFRSLRGRLNHEHGWTYLVMVFTVSFVIFVGGVRTGGHRILFPLIPLYALLVCGGATWLVRFLAARGRSPEVGRGSRVVPIGLVIAGVVFSVVLSTLKQLDFRDVREGRESLTHFLARSFEQGPSFGVLLAEGYGTPCYFARECDPLLRAEYDTLRQAIGPDDLILSTTPMEVNYFLGRVDGFMLIRREGRSYPTLSRGPTDEYLGAQIIDTADELRHLSGSDRRVWMIVPPREEGGSDRLSDTMRNVLEHGFRKHHEGPYFAVYAR